MDVTIAPEGVLKVLSRAEVNQLRGAGGGRLYETWRQCSLAVLNSGAQSDDVREILRRNQDFQISIIRHVGGIALELKNAPDHAFVDGQMIRGIREHLFAVLRDLLYVHGDVLSSNRFDLTTSAGITDAVFHILRNARALTPEADPRLVVCWGGHAVSREEYDYSKVVGYELGLRGMDICTGCGAGAMKGPMKGATVGHAKQRVRNARYLGLTEPTIIAAEAPNPIVNELVILPDMEKRLEAFVRLAHAIVVFPGGVGTAEEILYLLGILLNEKNQDVPLPLIFTGIAMAMSCWGLYGIFTHWGQHDLGGGRLKPLICVGFAYFLIAIVVPVVFLASQGALGGDWSFDGIVWSSAAGAAGAFGALGTILALSSGGKPIYVMPLIFGGAPVVNTLTGILVKNAWSEISPWFLAGLILVAIGAVMVLIFQPRGAKPHGGHKPTAPADAAPVGEAAK